MTRRPYLSIAALVLSLLVGGHAQADDLGYGPRPESEPITPLRPPLSVQLLWVLRCEATLSADCDWNYATHACECEAEAAEAD